MRAGGGDRTGQQQPDDRLGPTRFGDSLGTGSVTLARISPALRRAVPCDKLGATGAVWPTRTLPLSPLDQAAAAGTHGG